MKLEFINNAGVTNLGNELQSLAKTCKRFNIASAFITHEAINVLNIFLNKNKNSERSSRLIIGLYHCFNSKEILLELKKLSRASRGRLMVKISKTEKFHWKYYDFQDTKRRVVYNGSSNFTDAGMYQVGELQARITLTKADKKLNATCDQLFSDEWEHAEDIEDFPIDKYKAFKQSKAMLVKLDPAIRKLLFSIPVDNVINNLNPVRLTKLIGFLSKSTVKQISLNQSQWDKNNWNYFVCGTKREYDNYNKKDCLFVIDKTGNNYDFKLAVVEDKCQLKTLDGNYFVAYKIRGRKRKETSALRTVLSDVGINYRKRTDIDRKLTKNQALAIRHIFK